MMRKFISAALLFIISFIAKSQDTAKNVEMADGFRSDGKIYVVVAVILTIFTGLIIYLIRLDKKITKLEKDVL